MCVGVGFLGCVGLFVFFHLLIRVNFGTFDILDNEEVRQGLKKFSNWPTYPQLYVKGELIGGLDIVKVCGMMFLMFSGKYLVC